MMNLGSEFTVTGVEHDQSNIHPILPPELMDDIFEALRRIDDGKDALFASSVVCRAWNALTLRHRFHSLSFYMVRSFRSKHPSSDQLQDFLDSAVFPRAQHAVRVLSLRWRGIRIDPGFTRFVNRFPSLCCLELKGHISSPVDPSAEYDALVPDVRILTIHGQLPLAGGRSRRHFTSSLCELLRQFSSLDELRLLDIGGASAVGDTAALHGSLPAIGSLVLRSIGFGAPIASVVKELAGRQSLKRLNMLEYTGEELQETLDLVKCFDATPEHIRFSLTCWGKEMHADLSTLRDLKRLTVAIEVNPRDPLADGLKSGCFNDNNIPWNEATKTLWTLDPRCQLEYLEIYIGPADLDTDELFLERMLDTLSALSPVTLRAFEDIVLRLVGEGRLGHVAMSLYRAIPTEVGLNPRYFCPSEDHLRTIFPALDQAGVLCV